MNPAKNSVSVSVPVDVDVDSVSGPNPMDNLLIIDKICSYLPSSVLINTRVLNKSWNESSLRRLRKLDPIRVVLHPGNVQKHLDFLQTSKSQNWDIPLLPKFRYWVEFEDQELDRVQSIMPMELVAKIVELLADNLKLDWFKIQYMDKYAPHHVGPDHIGVKVEGYSGDLMKFKFIHYGLNPFGRDRQQELLNWIGRIVKTSTCLHELDIGYCCRRFQNGSCFLSLLRKVSDTWTCLEEMNIGLYDLKSYSMLSTMMADFHLLRHLTLTVPYNETEFQSKKYLLKVIENAHKLETLHVKFLDHTMDPVNGELAGEFIALVQTSPGVEARVDLTHQMI